jgi:hypothetical protein
MLNMKWRTKQYKKWLYFIQNNQIFYFLLCHFLNALWFWQTLDISCPLFYRSILFCRKYFQARELFRNLLKYHTECSKLKNLVYDWSSYCNNEATQTFHACLSSLLHCYMKRIWDVTMLLWNVSNKKIVYPHFGFMTDRPFIIFKLWSH